MDSDVSFEVSGFFEFLAAALVGTDVAVHSAFDWERFYGNYWSN